MGSPPGYIEASRDFSEHDSETTGSERAQQEHGGYTYTGDRPMYELPSLFCIAVYMKKKVWWHFLLVSLCTMFVCRTGHLHNLFNKNMEKLCFLAVHCRVVNLFAVTAAGDQAIIFEQTKMV